MRIRPPELETSICDAKYHVSLIEIKIWNSATGAAVHGGPTLARDCARMAAQIRIRRGSPTVIEIKIWNSATGAAVHGGPTLARDCARMAAQISTCWPAVALPLCALVARHLGQHARCYEPPLARGDHLGRARWRMKIGRYAIEIKIWNSATGAAVHGGPTLARDCARMAAQIATCWPAAALPLCALVARHLGQHARCYEPPLARGDHLGIGNPPPGPAGHGGPTLARDCARMAAQIATCWPAAALPLCALVARHLGQHARCYEPPLARGDHLGRARWRMKIGRYAVRLPHDDARRSAARWLEVAHWLHYTAVDDDRWACHVARGRASRLARRCAAAAREFRGWRRPKSGDAPAMS
ncbi:hypothetical protein F511_25452 [Dorcoceras hygrometricum]|uniref:Uncharacterized protein n=1 Tax=Dorcoceras hygrometricum TaxID=472368 RepID=A0A2Z7AGC0_9LAMI|nr:hypothetical protein F511_25452 [Dorcoceras hygrometricum]